MKLKPDFERFRAAVRHQEADRVPFYELLVDYGIQSRFIGREVSADDLESQVEFWAAAGYDFIPITVGMMEPGGVTKDSAISKVIEEVVLEDEEEAEARDDPAWSLEYHSFIKDRVDFEAFPWDVLAELNYDKFEDVKQYLPEGMKVIAVSGKIFTLTWMLMGFNQVASIAISVALLLGVEKIRTEARSSFASTISGTDLIVGARSGDINLLLYSVFRIGNATNNISWESYQDITSRPEVAWAIPISLGDSHRGFRVMGTNGDYFEHYRFARTRALTLAEGKPFAEVFDTVLGADVAAQLGYQLVGSQTGLPARR